MDASPDDRQSPPPAPAEQAGQGTVARAPQATVAPYPPEADPQADDHTEQAVVAGEQTDPDRRADVFPEDG